MPEFFGPFELMLNNDHVKHTDYYGAEFDYKINLDRVKNITAMAKTFPPNI